MTRKSALLCSMFALLTGCTVNDSLLDPPSAPEQLFWRVNLDQHAVQLPLGAGDASAMQLTVTPYTAAGTVYTAPASAEQIVTWQSADTSKVRVSSTGLVQAVGLTQGTVDVTILYQVNNVTRKDVAKVQVKAGGVMIDSVDARQLDSGKVAVGSSRSMRVRVYAGTTLVTGAITYVTLSDTNIARVSSVTSAGTATLGGATTVTGKQAGTTLLTATTWINGVVKSDTTTITVGYPIAYSFNAVNVRAAASSDLVLWVNMDQSGAPNPDTLVIGPGGSVGWTNFTFITAAQPGSAVDIIFDAAGQAAALADQTKLDIGGGTSTGNIIAIPRDTSAVSSAITVAARTRVRRFLTPGTYHYVVNPSDVATPPTPTATGVIIVQTQ